MHALHLPPRHLWRVTLMAVLLTLTVMAVLLPGRLGPESTDRVTAAPASDAVRAPATTPAARPPFVSPPEWLANPLTPPDFTVTTGR